MPNWVFNTISNYTEDLYEKYKGENGEIDFNKVIPEPEEISNTISGSISTDARDVVAYKNYCQKLIESGKSLSDYNLKYDHENPLKKPVENIANRALKNIGEICIENPNKSLNQLMGEPIDSTNRDYRRINLKDQYNNYINLFGNVGYSRVNNMQKVYQNYINSKEEMFQRNKKSEFDREVLKEYDSLEDYGRKLYELKEKYGFDNWYDWRCANWGTKWNASEISYDKDNQTLKFDTAWNIPYPVIAKIAEDNPKANLDGYSEEETGWFEEYKSQDGKLVATARGKITYNEETDETSETREEITPEPLYYKELVKQYIDNCNRLKQSIDNLF